MKSLYAVAHAQRNLSIAGAGLAFVTALIFCEAMAVPGLRFFWPFRNEFLSLARLLFWFAAFLIGYSHAPARKTRSTFYCFLLRYWFGLVPLLFLCFPHLFTDKKYFPLFGWAFFCVTVGLFAGELRQYVVRPVHYHLSCLAGAAAGVMFAWLLRLRPGLVGPNRVLFLMLFILLWVIFRRIWQWKCGRLVRIVSMILWGICIVYPCGRLVPLHLHQDTADKRRITPAEIAISGLQPGRKDLNILIVSDSPRLTDEMGAFPLTRKLFAVSPKDSAGLSRLLDHAAGEFDLIVLELPIPDNLCALRMYSPENLQKIRQALDEDGVLAVFLPEDILPQTAGEKVRLHDLAAKTSKAVFPSVKSAGGDFPILFCGGPNVTDSPEELNRRARGFKLMPSYLPDGAFALLPPPEPTGGQADTSLQGLDLMWQVIRKQDSMINWTGLGGVLDGIRCVLLPGLTGLLILVLAIRYFFSGGTENKRGWLSMENGLYLGLTAVLLLVPYQLDTGRLDPDWLPLTGIFLIAAFAGILASAGHHHSALLRKLLLGVSLLAPWCGLVFLCGYYRPDPVIYYALAGYVGYTSGMTAADIRSEWSVTLTGFCIGLLLGGLLCWVPGGTVWASVLAVLCRIPPLIAENLQKRFEKSPRRS